MEPTKIDGFPDYLLYPDGRIYCDRTACFLNPGKDHAGYIQVGLKSSSGKKFTRRLHRLLAEHFIPKEDECDLVDHIDKNRTNNDLSNLRWSNHVKNAQNTSAKDRETYCISYIEDRQMFSVTIPQPDGPAKYVGCMPTLKAAQVMRDNALVGIYPVAERLDTYCITARPVYSRFEVSIPIGPRKYKYVGHGKTLEEAQRLRDTAIEERDSDPDAWRPKMCGKLVYPPVPQYPNGSC